MRCWTRTCATPRIASQGATSCQDSRRCCSSPCRSGWAAAPTVLHEQALVTEEFHGSLRRPRHRALRAQQATRLGVAVPGERIVLFVHGSTYPAETAFDLPLNGVSWMEYIARQGYDVYLVDLRGYRRSTRPPEMDQPAERNAPLTTTSTAVKDVGSAADFIRKRRGVERINLLGWSWGPPSWPPTPPAIPTGSTSCCCMRRSGYAPRPRSSRPAGRSAPIGSCRKMRRKRAAHRSAGDEESRADSPGWFEAWAGGDFRLGPWGLKQNPKKLRAPNGTQQDTREYWSAGKAYYEPETIRVPTLLLVGDGTRTRRPTWRRPCSEASQRALQAARADRRGDAYRGDGKEPHALFRAVQAFLDQPAPRP